MTDIDEELDSFIDTIIETKEYKDYKNALSALSAYPEVKAQIDELRRRNYEIQQSDMDPQRLMQEMDKLENEYESFRADPKVNNFLASELAFIKLMQYIYSAIMESVEFE